jgi:hypothetical protein
MIFKNRCEHLLSELTWKFTTGLFLSQFNPAHNNNINFLIRQLCVILEKVQISNIMKKFTAIMEPPRIISVFTRARKWSVCCEKLILSTSSRSIPSRTI